MHGYYEAVSHFIYRSSRARGELSQLFALIDGENDYASMALQTDFAPFIKQAQALSAHSAVADNCHDEFQQLIQKLTLMHEMTGRPFPSKDETEMDQMAPYVREPDAALELIQRCKDRIIHCLPYDKLA